ncbi:MAG: flavin reductase family protein, partial [Amphiplicatus sp.]
DCKSTRINKSASIAPPLIDEGRFAINVLDISQQQISEDCSGRKTGDDRFADQDWASDHLDTPYLQSSQATIFCRVASTWEYGTHLIVFGAVEGVRANDRPTPLIYLDRRYLDVSLNTTVP